MYGTETAYDQLPNLPIKGRGSISNRVGRFERQDRVAIDDGWRSLTGETERPKLRTTLSVDTSKKVITYNQSPDVPFDRSINPYRGCEHGCVYCFARPSHAYWGLSAGLDFESKLFHKPDAPEILAKELSKKGYKPGPIALGANTDPYQPVERDQQLTRHILEVLAEFKHPFSIITKSDLVLRDLDIIAPMAKQGLASVAVSVTTLDRKLANRLEPRACTPSKRLEAIHKLSKAGVPVTTLVAPIIPAINDHEIEAILQAVTRAGALSAGYVLLRLPREIDDLFCEWLDAYAPDRKDRVLSLIEECREGKRYRSFWGKRMTGSGVYADMIKQRFRLARKRLGLDQRHWQLDCSQFTVPPQVGDQMSLL